jgi:hypothetical protein
MHGFLKKNKKKLSQSFNFSLHYDVLSINISKLGDFVDAIYPTQLEI